MCFLFSNISNIFKRRKSKKKKNNRISKYFKKNHKNLPFSITKLIQKGKYNSIYTAKYNNQDIIIKCCYRFKK